MAYVNLLDLDDLTPGARAVAESGQEQYGTLLHTWRALFHRPEIFESYLPFLRSVAGPGAMDQEVKDLSALLVAWLNGCRYTVSHRWSGALRNGADPDRVLDVVGGRWDEFPAPLRCALELAREMTTQPSVLPASQEPGLLSTELRDEVSRHFTQAQVVELTMSLSMWNALSRFHRVMQLDLDMPAPPEQIDEQLLPGRNHS
jgi:AhpD family alkylhydroperoxidase